MRVTISRLLISVKLQQRKANRTSIKITPTNFNKKTLHQAKCLIKQTMNQVMKQASTLGLQAMIEIISFQLKLKTNLITTS